MIQLTEQEAKLLINNIFADQEDTINYWKEKEWIKKSKLEEARDYYDLKIDNVDSRDFMKLRDLYEEAIKEILENKK